MSRLLADLRFAARSMRRRALLTGLAAASLVLALGGNGAMFSFMNALLLGPMPYSDPDSVVMIRQGDPGNPGTDLIRVASANYDDWRRSAESFAVLAAQRIRPMSLREAATLAGPGFLIGAPFMVVMVVFVRELLVGMALSPPFAAFVVAALLLGVSLPASWLPARRAARVPPSRALRHDGPMIGGGFAVRHPRLAD